MAFLICTSTRSSRIAQKERDLALLSRVGPEQFGRFEELQNNANARTIQQAWRKKREFEYIHRCVVIISLITAEDVLICKIVFLEVKRIHEEEVYISRMLSMPR